MAMGVRSHSGQIVLQLKLPQMVLCPIIPSSHQMDAAPSILRELHKKTCPVILSFERSVPRRDYRRLGSQSVVQAKPGLCAQNPQRCFISRRPKGTRTRVRQTQHDLTGSFILWLTLIVKGGKSEVKAAFGNEKSTFFKVICRFLHTRRCSAVYIKKRLSPQNLETSA